jgi:transposase-like protein
MTDKASHQRYFAIDQMWGRTSPTTDIRSFAGQLYCWLMLLPVDERVAHRNLIVFFTEINRSVTTLAREVARADERGRRRSILMDRFCIPS